MRAADLTKAEEWPSRPRRQKASPSQSGRERARAWSLTVPERQRQQAAWTFIKAAVDAYVASIPDNAVRVTPSSFVLSYVLEEPAAELARLIGREAGELPIDQACYELSAAYVALVPSETRSALGMYYTPPTLTDRLLDMAEEAGIDWRTARVLDPACGGGAFLLPAALRIRKATAGAEPRQQLSAISNQIRGFEIDPFAAWLTQAWLEIALADLIKETGTTLPKVVQVCNTLDQQPRDVYDLVIGNPPYGRLTLTTEQRRRFARSLYGHANLYGVFTDIALQWTKAQGVIAYVTPTSFLAGEYFKSLRALLATEAPPVAIDFIGGRRGVFEDVLQEALLATYRKSGKLNGAAVNYLAVSSGESADITHAGHLRVPAKPAAPWLAPRAPQHRRLIDCLARMPDRLADWGYQVSTGPLVWNRFKDQLRERPGKNSFPLVWAEAVTTDGRFIHRADKRGHQPYFQIKNGDEWLKVNVPCVLVQRTTAKEQARRLIAAEMPGQFIKEHGAVVVENHLNMVRPIGKTRPRVSPGVLAAVLNSSVVDEAFRCISGSVAVSAFELEALPLPAADDMAVIDNLIRGGAKSITIGARIRALYRVTA
jgi:adenine-specific DNA-methyltransferase